MRTKSYFFILLIGISLGNWSCKGETFAPSIMTIDPLFGPVETLVVVEGEHLAGIESITFSGNPINFNNAYNADHALLFRIPETVPLGEHEVLITTASGTVSTNFRVTFDPPEIFGLAPSSAGPGDEIVIYGENFYEPIEIYFFDSVAAEIVWITEDSLKVVVPEGIQQGFVQVVANGGVALSPQRFFSVRNILVNDFDGNGLRAETNKWVFRGSVTQNGSNAVQSADPEPIEGGFLKLSGSDDLNISWIGGAQNHIGFPGDTFETFGITTVANNTLLELDVNSNGVENTHVILILLEKDGSPNDFTHEFQIDWDGWDHLSIPLNRFKDLNDVIVDPTKVRVIKIHLIDNDGTGTMLEANIDNLTFIEIL